MSDQITNVGHEERKILDNIKCDDIVKVALVKHEYKEPTMMQLAKHVGFNEEELNMLAIFWDSVFNKSWIILNRDMIKTWFCKNDTSVNAVKNFYDRVLLKYDEGIDYIQIERSPATDKCDESCSSKTMSKIRTKHGGHNAKYYQVTGECFKMIGMQRNKDIQRYYIKVEELAMYMRDYMSAMHQYISAKRMGEQQLVIDKSKQDINDMRIINERVQLHINNTKALNKTSTFYIATSKIYAAQNIFKPGCIDSISDKQLKSRLAQYNTGKTGDDLFYFCHVEEVYASKELDYKLKKLLQQLKFNCKKEMVVVHYDSLIKIVRHVSANHTEDYEYFNTFINSGEYKLSLNLPPVIPQPIIFGTHTVTITEQKNGNEIASTVIDIANLTDAEKRQYLIQAIEIFCTNNGTNYNHDEEKHSDKKIVVVWKDLQTILKGICHTAKLQPSKWRNPLKSIGDDSKSIQQIKWLNRNKASTISVSPPTL
jgi:hypothetical protein